MAGDYARYQKLYSSKSMTLQVLTTTDDTTLITSRSANHEIWIQRIVVSITTYAAKTWTFQDSTATPIKIAHISIPAAAVALPSESNAMVHDFGPEGVRLPLGKNFVLDVSATGAAGTVHIDAYERLGPAFSAFVAMGPLN